MPFDFSHIGHAPHTEPKVLSIESSGNGAGDRGFAHARRPVETQNLSLSGATQLTDCNKLLQLQTQVRIHRPETIIKT